MRLNVADFRQRARRVLPRFVFDYVEGGAEDERCLARNRADLERLDLLPQGLRDTRHVDTGVDVFGQRWAAPVGVAPVGLAGLVRPGGDVLAAAAAGAAGLPYVLSTASNSRLEAVREATSGPCWMQLYVMQARELAEQIVQRAQAAGFDALVLTIDVPVSGYRERDVRNGFSLPFRPGPAMLWDMLRHPRWLARMAASGAPGFVNLAPQRQTASPQAQAALLARAMDRSLVWEDLAWLRSLWRGPLLLKGVLHPEDARRAASLGVDGIIVSNHGGRQLDAAPSAIRMLPQIRAAAGQTLPLFVDGGVRRGADVARALASGANGVFVGRPMAYGLAVAGQAGVEQVLTLLAAELARTMTLMGVARVQDFGATHICRQDFDKRGSHG
ncbi:alpha-hydroxy acid oxidase [Bordetella genomosp. 12]|uniref:Alpha-hydroxy-acid oxidizing enzyme n=1 Tax=Bordetella genomosp. 12 TaxID=463035 RepID=A0A261VW39_9BORD|nr:alpha-hydroxy acid oxidase [Bordetella genomosp. 12]OZI77820.1 alpha-hydroxy-acid oxidizing enzyme [Bordetella genomosp. 12]